MRGIRHNAYYARGSWSTGFTGDPEQLLPRRAGAAFVQMSPGVRTLLNNGRHILTGAQWRTGFHDGPANLTAALLRKIPLISF